MNKKINISISAVLWLFLLLFFGAATGHAEVVKVSLLLGDTHSRTAIEAVRAVSEELKKTGFADSDGKTSGRRGETFDIRVYPDKDIEKKDLTHLRESRLVVIFIMGGQLLKAVKPEIAEVVRKGGRVYDVGAAYNDDTRRMGILFDKKMQSWFQTATPANIKNMILYALNETFGLGLPLAEPLHLPEVGIYDRATKKIFPDVASFCAARPPEADSAKKPWVGVVFHNSTLESGQTKALDALIESMEHHGMNVLPVFGSVFKEKDAEALLQAGNVRVVVALGWKIGINPAKFVSMLSRLDVPVINAIALRGQSAKEWRESAVGLDIFERAWQVGNPEMAGIIQPTVVASKETVIDPQSGAEYVEERPIAERIERLASRVGRWVALRCKPNPEKKIALIYYSYPPGKHNIGASYLNVLPESLYEIARRMEKEGYNTGGLFQEGMSPEQIKERIFDDIHNYSRNIGNWAPGELDRLVKTGKPVMIPLANYRTWFSALPEGFQKAVVKKWGDVEKNAIMLWKNQQGEKFIVIPAIAYGNVVLTPQPARGWQQDVVKLYHDVTLPPHHQYIAFYLWLKHWFQADAVVHVGTHGTHEWLSGREIGFTDEDPPEALIQDLPNIYPYIVDNVGEGIQAKRRGMAVVIDHMTPPFDKAGMNQELKGLAALISDYHAAREKSPSLAASKLAEINALAKKTGMLTDLKLKSVRTGDEIEALDDHIKDIAETITPFGLHTFGKAPDASYRRSTAEAIVSIDEDLNRETREKRIAEMEKRIEESATAELDALIAALAGRYIPAAQGNDPLRNPDSLPTGKNFYAFDASRLPSRATYQAGAKLAKELIDGYRKRHGRYPDKLAYTIWAVETIRHEGVMESQVMNLMGIRPKWDARGRVVGVEAIPRAELGRPRIDVAIVTTGLYRDLFSNLMALLDSAVSAARDETEEDNLVRSHVLKAKKMLMAKGVSEEEAKRLASVRIFTETTGSYGTGLSTAIPMSNTWDNEQKLADLFLKHEGHLFGQGFWGEGDAAGQKGIGVDLLKGALSGAKIAIHSMSTNLYATLDNDDFFQYLGGTALAIRSVDGKSPEVYVTNLANPRRPQQETLERTIGREMRSRYLNPAWIKAMLHEGYAGARFVDKVVEHLWGWQVTTPEVVDAAKWQEMYETYVLDKNGLGMKELFKKAQNLHSYQSIVARMAETVRKEYWKPESAVVERLAEEYAKTAIDVGLACCDHTCNNPLLTKYTSNVLVSVPGLAPLNSGFLQALRDMKEPARAAESAKGARQPGQQNSSPAASRQKEQARPSQAAPGGKTQMVEGYKMEEVGAAASAGAPIPYLFMLGFLVFVGLIAIGFRKRR
jgi:cobaltochelatase CobN